VTIVLGVLALFIVTTAHEAGHGVAVLARGGRVNRIQVGRGPAVFRGGPGGTRVVLAAFPFGGRIHYEGIASRTAEAVIAVAGPLANLVLSFAAFWSGAVLRGAARMPYGASVEGAWEYAVQSTATWLWVIPGTVGSLLTTARATELGAAVRVLRVVATAGGVEGVLYLIGALSALWAMLNMIPVPGVGTDGWRFARALARGD
jgi:membrane-associated protease RseP (regulator of RpoE activity)